LNRTTLKLGFWSAILSAVLAVLWFVTFQMQDVFAAVPAWQNLDAYAGAYRMVRLTLVYPSLLLALAYIVLMAVLHRRASDDRKVWSLIALSVGILYATMASINYHIQAVAVRQSLAAGETAGVQLWIPDNPHSAYTALANSYVYMSISMAFAAFVFGRGRLQGWIRGLLLAQVLSAIGQVGWSMFDWSDTIFIATSMVWVIGAPAAFVLMAVLFRRQGRRARAAAASRHRATASPTAQPHPQGAE
jgi:hypothetical protein